MWSILENEQKNYQGSIIYPHKKATLRKKLSKSLYGQFNTFESLLLPTAKTISKS